MKTICLAIVLSSIFGSVSHAGIHPDQCSQAIKNQGWNLMREIRQAADRNEISKNAKTTLAAALSSYLAVNSCIEFKVVLDASAATLEELKK